MAMRGLQRCLLALVAVMLFAAGPGGPFCMEAVAAQPEAMAMTDCGHPAPAGKKTPPAHPHCVAPCIAINGAAATLAPRVHEEMPLAAPDGRTLVGVHPAPGFEPPRR